MIRLFAASIAVALASACSDEPDVVVVEPIEEEDVEYSAGQPDPTGWDADGDGMLNREEYSNLSDRAWEIWDVDRDGSLSREEFEAGWTEAGFNDPTGAFDALDHNDDDIVVQADFSGAVPWEQWDVDDSGVLEPGEFEYY